LTSGNTASIVSSVDFTNEFRVSLPLDFAWELLGDVERIAPCMPGAQLTGVDGDEYRGTVKLKVGPMTTQYLGTATIEERDVEHHTMSIRARGRESRGQGNADATVTASLLPDGDGTLVTVATELRVTGKVAQFGKGVIEDISRKLMGQFAASLEQKLAAPSEVSAAESTLPLPPRAEAESESEPEAGAGAVDLLSVVGGPLVKRLVPLVLVLVAVVILIRKLT
jgi:carbon monoxide dehydrogenase subunit G